MASYGQAGQATHGISFNPVVRSFSGQQQAALRNSTTQGFGTRQANFSTSTPYAQSATFYGGQPRETFWSTKRKLSRKSKKNRKSRKNRKTRKI